MLHVNAATRASAKSLDAGDIDLSEKPSVESREVSAGVVLDYDAGGNLVGIDTATGGSPGPFNPALS